MARKKNRESAAGQPPLSRGQEVFSQCRHVLENWFLKICLPGFLIHKKYALFQHLRQGDRSALELISRLEEIRQKQLVCDYEHIKHLCRLLDQMVEGLVDAIIAFNPLKYSLLRNYCRKYAFYASLALTEEPPPSEPPYVLPMNAQLSEVLAGGKAAALSALCSEREFGVPPGLVVTTRAFSLLLERNALFPFIEQELSRLGPDNSEELQQVSLRIQSGLLDAEAPAALEEEVWRGMEELGMEQSALALRSSAVGEDLQASFAGQFESRLDVAPRDWFQVYKQVLASKYSPHALYYRMSRGFSDLMTPMAVIIMPTIRARVSGILYTRDQNEPDKASTYMVSGSGQSLAGGAAGQGLASFDIRREELCDLNNSGLLSLETISALFHLGQKLEAISKTPQDVEWLVDEQERIHIVQSRPLRISSVKPGAEDSYPEDAVLARGQWVSSGRASGRIYKPGRIPSVSEIPDQAILVTGELPPELTLALHKVRAVIAEYGSPACHFASVAREYGIPVICGVGGAESIAAGKTVSIDSDVGVVLSGALFTSESPQPGSREPDSPVFAKLSEALRFISPLSLQDPDAADFSIRSCKSLHDIVRYVHEAAVREMFFLVGRRGLDSYGAKRLISGLPLVMHVLDVHKGIAPAGKSGKAVELKHIQSRPMQELFAGLASPAVQWNENILHYDWDAYAKSTASFVNVEKSTMFSSYAILDSEYVHALLRFGYHFAVLDAVQGSVAEQNYIHFSFKGGGGNTEQRVYRTELIRIVLEHFQFVVDIHADLLEAFFDRRSRTDTGINLARLGIVLGKTVLLDMRLSSEQQVRSLAETIIGEAYDFFPVQKIT
ncbi:MAG: PEP/pyruvate-binding domain-containing protein [Desulfosalsimonadaceae bacterium]